MKSVLQIACSYFRFVPLQRWINGIGLALLAVCMVQLLLGALGSNSRTLQTGSVFALLGVILIALGPAFAGGAMLRLASKRSLLHLRPHGRIRVILGTTLAITLLATLITTPVLMDHAIAHTLNAGSSGTSPFSHAGSLQVFFAAWSCIALTWCGVFFAINVPPLFFAMLATTPLAIKLGSPLISATPNLAMLFAFSAGAWLAFSYWYLKVPTIRAPVWAPGTSPFPSDYPIDRAATAATRFAGRLLRTRSNTLTVAQAQRFYLLGSATPLAQLIAGTMTTLVFVAIWIWMTSKYSLHQLPSFFLLMIQAMPASMGFSIVRRARLLWLRAGHDRAGLFAIAERNGLPATAALMASINLAFLWISLTNSPDQAAVILMFTVEQWAFSCLLFYAGLSATRGWDTSTVLLTAGLFGLFLAHVVTIQPHRGTPSSVVAVALLLLLPLVYLQRRYALRRWRQLDWRIAQLPRQPGRA